MRTTCWIISPVFGCLLCLATSGSDHPVGHKVWLRWTLPPSIWTWTALLSFSLSLCLLAISDMNMKSYFQRFSGSCLSNTQNGQEKLINDLKFTDFQFCLHSAEKNLLALCTWHLAEQTGREKMQLPAEERPPQPPRGFAGANYNLTTLALPHNFWNGGSPKTGLLGSFSQMIPTPCLKKGKLVKLRRRIKQSPFGRPLLLRPPPPPPSRPVGFSIDLVEVGR